MPYQVSNGNSRNNNTVECDLNAPQLGDGVLIGSDFTKPRAVLTLKDPTEIPFDIRVESPSLRELEINTPFHLRCNIVLSGQTKGLKVSLYGIDRGGPISGEESKIVIKEDARSPISGRRVGLVIDRVGPARASRLPSEVAQDVEDQTQLRLETNLALEATFRDCSNCSVTVAGHEDQGMLQSLAVENSALHRLTIDESISTVENFSLRDMSARKLQLTSPIVNCTLTNSRILGGEFLPSRLVHLKVTQYVKLQDTEVDVGMLEFACLDRSHLDLSDADYIDQWNILRDTYTGARFFINLLFLVMYCLPLLSKVALYWGMGAIENSSGRGDLIPEGWVERSVADILFFGTSGNETVRWSYFVLAMSVLIYQVLRLYLTIRVSSLREREEHMDAKGYKNTRPPYDRLTGPYVLHRFMKSLLFLSMISVVWRLAEVLFITLHVPAN
ncbi:hypothetical protein OAU50_07100 [Planctomycetota bacterium]|nr:hypothetical protein [Planctomycetota bacterium]